MFETIQGALGLVADKNRRADKGSGQTAPRRKRVAAPDSHVAASLRAAYEETVSEDVPDDFIDLLGKLS